MKVTINSASEKKLVAVLGVDGQTIFLPDANDTGSFVITQRGYISSKPETSLVNLLRTDKDRKPIYEGDSITIQF